MLHVFNGDCAAEGFRESGRPGETTVWAETLHEGPLPIDAEPEQWRQVRAHFYAEGGHGTVAENAARLATWDAALDRVGEHDEVVFWVEHDLFDQLLLIRHLDWLGRRGPGSTRWCLVCIGAFPGVERFIGLGQLEPAQIGSLLESRRPITADQVRLGTAAWRAYAGPDPSAIEGLLARDTSCLPSLRAALIRHLERFPSVRNGLGRTESQILAVLASRGPMRITSLFQACQDAEEAPFLGDRPFLDGYVGPLSRGSEPLIRVSCGERLGADVILTETGRRVQEGKADAVSIVGLDRWLGGVHLRGREAAWRWDEASRHLVPNPRPRLPA